MLVKTQGIVLSHTKYSDNSIIVNIYTESHGKQPFIVRRSKSKASRLNLNYFKPFYILNLEIDYKENRRIQNIKDFSNHHPHSSIPFNVYKSTISIFLTEIISMTLHEEEANNRLFTFLSIMIQILDSIDDKLIIANFNNYFLLKYTKYIGFFPTNNYSDSICYFNLQKGEFTDKGTNYELIIDKELSLVFSYLLNIINNDLGIENKINSNTIKFRHIHKNRKHLLEKILIYYKLHIEAFKTLKSYNILKEVFK